MPDVQKLIILPHEPIGVIAPQLHGQFAEHLGTLVYPGLWAGSHSSVPNDHGLRRDVIDALRPLEIPILRWPGGNFADSYRWRDGIGPQETRPLRVNTQWGNAPEPNHFGTHEFMALCRALGAAPYVAGNLGSETPAYLRDWVEYCNHAGPGALAAERAANGSSAPFNVVYWGVGNETWGAGGHMGPEHYAAEYCRYRTYLHEYSGCRPLAIGSGANGADWDWTRRFFGYLATNHWDRRHLLQGYAVHYYTWNMPAHPSDQHPTRYGTATDFTNDDWTSLLAVGLAVEGIIRGHRAIMDEFDPARRIPLILDEWGTWHPAEAGHPSWGLFQQNSLRDAAVAALSLNIFHQLADQLSMANLAQLVNVLQSLLLVDEQRCIRTPTYHVFDLYRPHRGATSVRIVPLVESFSDGGRAAADCQKCYLHGRAPAVPRVHASASTRAGRLCVTLVNLHPTDTQTTEVTIPGAALGPAELVRLAADELQAHNTFDEPNRVTLSTPVEVQPHGDKLILDLPPGSITRLQCAL